MNLQENWKTYYWKVKAKNKYGESGWSPVMSFATIGRAPELYLPLNNAEDVSNQPVLTWKQLAKADTYTLQISSKEDFSEDPKEMSGLKNFSQKTDSLKSWGIYYWRVKADGQYGTTPWSASWRFTVAGTAPKSPSLYLPSDGDRNVETALDLKWLAPEKADSFSVQVAKDSLFTSLIYNQRKLPAGSIRLNGLNNWTHYYWRVSAQNKYGSSGWSGIWKFTTIGPVPLLNSPENNKTNVPLTPLLKWYAVKGAGSYSVQVSTSRSFSDIVYSRTGLQDTSNLTLPLDPLVTHYWRIRAESTIEPSPLSEIWSFRTAGSAPPAPVLLSPSDNAQKISGSVILYWNASQDAATYTLQVATDTAFNIKIAVDSLLKGTSKMVTGLGPQTKYYWRVNAQNNYGTSLWSHVWSFTTGNIPNRPRLYYPGNNSTEIPKNPTLVWNYEQDPTRYKLQLAKDSLFSDYSLILSRDSVTSSSFPLSPQFLKEPLKGYTTYFWRVSGENAHGSSGWSEIWNFTTTDTVPPAPKLLKPEHNDLNRTLPLQFRWTESRGAYKYQLQIAPNNTFRGGELIYDKWVTLDTVYTVIQGLKFLGQYYWRVRAVDYNNLESAWSQARAFQMAPPPVPVIISPADSAEGLTIPVSLNWGPLSGPYAYTVQVASDTGFTANLITLSVSSEVAQISEGITYSKKYYWRVQANYSDMNSSWTNRRMFSTAALAVPSLAYPVDNADTLYKDITFYWNASPGAKSYTLQVSADTAFTSGTSTMEIQSGLSQAFSGTYNKKYYWRVCANGDYGKSAWSPVWSFRTAALQEPALSLPNNSAVNTAIPVSLSWVSVTGASGYIVEIARDSMFTDIAFRSNKITASCLADTGITYSTKYFWRVKATKTGGSSIWSVVRSFSTIALGVPGLNSPADSAININQPVTLRWTGVSGITTYYFEIAADSTFSTLKHYGTVNTISAEINVLLGGMTYYYWRVRSVNNIGKSAWSPYRRFRTSSLISPPPVQSER